MKKTLLLMISIVSGLLAQAQLPWNTELTKEYFENSSVHISSVGTAQWANLGGVSLSEKSSDAVITLPSTGLAHQLTFKYRGGVTSSALGTFLMAIYESNDHSNWTMVWSNSTYHLTNQTADPVTLKNTTRYIKLEYTATSSNSYINLVAGTTGTFVDVKVTELQDMATSIDEYTFPTRMVDDASDAKSLNVTWTNIHANVNSSDPHFVVSSTVIGQKAQMGSEAQSINQTTPLVITYLHNEAGTHNANITISDGNLTKTIAVSGTTNKYDQQLFWNQELGTHLTTEDLLLNAYTDFSLPVQYTSSDSAIAYVDENGHVVISSYGTVTLTAQQPGNYKYNATQSISKTLTLNRANPVIAITADNLVYGQTIEEAHLQETTGNVAGELSFVGIAKDSVLEAGTYDLQAVFTPTLDKIYNTVNRMVQLTVDKATQTLAWTQTTHTLAIGDTLLINATLTSGLLPTFAKTSNIVDIEGNRLIGRNEGEVLIVGFHEGNRNYLPTTVEMKSFTVAGGELPVIKKDTIWLRDTIYVPVVDTVYLTDTIYIHPSTPTEFYEMSAPEREDVKVVKYIRQGQMYIRRQDEVYLMNGERVE